MPYIETDSWTNYREALRLELEHDYRTSKFKDGWAKNFRRAVFVENSEEISKLIESDILERIKLLEDSRQEFEVFRYTPLGDTYKDLQKRNEHLKVLLAETQTKYESLKLSHERVLEALMIAERALETGVNEAIEVIRKTPGAIESEGVLLVQKALEQIERLKK